MAGADSILCRSSDFGFKAYHMPSYSKSDFMDFIVKPDTYTTDASCFCTNNECALKFTRDLVLTGDTNKIIWTVFTGNII